MANQTYISKKDNPFFVHITKNMIAELSQITDPITRALHTHRRVDEAIHNLVVSDTVKNHISCQKGCHHCCHTQVSVTSDETKLCATLLVKTGKLDKKLRLLHTQSKAGNSTDKWYQIPYSLRSCAFLNDDGSCCIYEHRPSVCRTTYVLGSADNCSTVDGKIKPVRSLNTFRADMIVIGSFLFNRINGALPYMLWEEIKQARWIRGIKEKFVD